MASFRRQVSMDGYSPVSTPNRGSFHGRANSEDRSSFSSCSSDRDQNGIFRSDSHCGLTKRSFLRKRIVEQKELENGVRAGCRAVCFHENPQLGTVKWIGKINQIIFIGIEFDNPIGTNFPETKGAPPFRCSLQHGRLVSQADLLLVTDPHGKTILSTEKPESLSKASSQTSVSKLEQEFSTKLQEFYEFSLEAENVLDKLGEELDAGCARRLTVDPMTISVALERHKSYLNEVEDRHSLIDWCRSKSEALFSYGDILLPSEELRINRTVKEVSDMHQNIETKLKRRIQDLEWALESCHEVQGLLHEKLGWLTEARAQLRHMEKSLVKTEPELSSRLGLIESLLQAFTPEESDELVDILERISQLHEMTGNSPEVEVDSQKEKDPNNKFDSQLGQIMSLRNQLLEEVGTKYEMYKGARKLFRKFTKHVASFEEWYDPYLDKVCGQDDQGTGIDYDVVKEKEVQRGEFLKILKIATKLKISIFHPSAVLMRIESLQNKWRHLMDVCYQNRFRKAP